MSRLCRRIQEEKDPKTFDQLVRELNDLLVRELNDLTRSTTQNHVSKVDE